MATQGWALGRLVVSYCLLPPPLVLGWASGDLGCPGKEPDPTDIEGRGRGHEKVGVRGRPLLYPYPPGGLGKSPWVWEG